MTNEPFNVAISADGKRIYAADCNRFTISRSYAGIWGLLYRLRWLQWVAYKCGVGWSTADWPVKKVTIQVSEIEGPA